MTFHTERFGCQLLQGIQQGGAINHIFLFSFFMQLRSFCSVLFRPNYNLRPIQGLVSDYLIVSMDLLDYLTVSQRPFKHHLRLFKGNLQPVCGCLATIY